MKEDYLWDKTGESAEIKMLENALQTFRYREIAPPALPAKILPFKKEPSRRVFRFAMAAAACLVFGLFALSALVQLLNNKTETKSDLVEVTKPQSEMPFIAPPTIEESEVLPSKNSDGQAVKRIKNSKQTSVPQFVQIRNSVPATVRQKEILPLNKKNIRTEVQLTKEEQYAYEQLLLALSITSSKLKIVKDKVQGLEEKTIARENGR